MDYVIPSQKIAAKLAKRGITLEQCVECFSNRTGRFLFDTRERHRINPPTLWFISTTDANRLLKIVFIHYPAAQEIHLKSAYDPNQIEINLYNQES